MFKVLFLMILLLAGIVIAPHIAGKQGYVLIETVNYRYEMSITMLFVFFVACLAVVYAVQGVLERFFKMSNASYTWFARRKHKKAQRQTLEGLVALDEGKYKKAQRLIGDNAKYSDNPILYLTKAAEAAQKAGNDLAANRYLLEANELAGGENFIVSIGRLKILVAQQKWDDARESVDNLLKNHRDNKEVLCLAVTIFKQQKAYQALDDILIPVEKSGLYDHAELMKLESFVDKGLQNEQVEQAGHHGLMDWFHKQARSRRQRVSCQLNVIERLIDSNEHDKATDFIVDVLKKSKQETADNLRHLYQQIIRLYLKDSAKLRKLLAKQAQKTPELRTDIHRALGYLNARAENFAEACQNFNEVLKDKAHTQDADMTMAAFVFEQNGEPQLAEQIRRDSVKVAMAQGKTTSATLKEETPQQNIKTETTK